MLTREHAYIQRKSVTRLLTRRTFSKTLCMKPSSKMIAVYTDKLETTENDAASIKGLMWHRERGGRKRTTEVRCV